MVELFANNGDPEQMPCSAASDLGLHCLPVKVYVMEHVMVPLPNLQTGTASAICKCVSSIFSTCDWNYYMYTTTSL